MNGYEDLVNRSSLNEPGNVDWKSNFVRMGYVLQVRKPIGKEPETVRTVISRNAVDLENHYFPNFNPFRKSRTKPPSI